MKNIVLIFLAAIFFAACNSIGTVEFSGDLALGEVVEGTLEVETPDTFQLELDAGTFLYGIANQLTVDVVVTLYDSAGATLGVHDGPGRGPEVFTFEVEEAGSYLLENKPFEKESGDYTLELKRVEAPSRVARPGTVHRLTNTYQTYLSSPYTMVKLN